MAIIPFSVNGWVEYITATIADSLVVDSMYELCYYMRHARAESGLFVNRIEAKFHDTRKLFPWLVDKSINLNNEAHYYNRYKNSRIVADVRMSLDRVNADTAWVEVRGTYKARGGERFVTLGVFYNEAISIPKMLKYASVQYASKTREQQYEKEQRTIKWISKDKDELYYTNPKVVNLQNQEFECGLYFLDDVCLEMVKK